MKKAPSAAPVRIAEVLETLIEMGTHGREPTFRELANAAGLDPGRDFIGTSLRDLDFRDEDLRGFDFSQADLTGADFRRANITGVSFLEADLTGAVGVALGADIFDRLIRKLEAPVFDPSNPFSNFRPPDLRGSVLARGDREIIR
jgi:uncharacterized protein YjbI with pentapeptide repeats